ncbi:MAG: VIT1/CCC1 transporter family protein [Cytophagales bacterium]|nr:VIT1/CCC1 transporter family protein [Cytophagales bacterium]
MEKEEKHFTSSGLVRDVVIGMSDGLTVPFALAAGLSGAVNDTHIIIAAGIAEIAAGSIAMGLGGYMAGKTEMQHYENEYRRELWEVDYWPDKEKQEVKEVFKNMGLDEQSQNMIVDRLSQDKNMWVDFMMRFELGLEKPDKNRATLSGITIAGAYIAGGIIPLSGYFFTDIPLYGLAISSCITAVCLLIFGYMKSKLTGQNPIKGAVNVLIIGGVASLAAYALAKLFTD